MRQRTIFDDSVASRVEQLLQRVEGERHARQIAQRDQVQESRTSTRKHQ